MGCESEKVINNDKRTNMHSVPDKLHFKKGDGGAHAEYAASPGT